MHMIMAGLAAVSMLVWLYLILLSPSRRPARAGGADMMTGTVNTDLEALPRLTAWDARGQPRGAGCGGHPN